ncbi:radical SAM superfamily enzyme YgiQ (UPF0313 family) [Nocardioides aurantiacus]|uniref:Radical SAM superfamily enzyme YgiQ (UPF0313 family) n=1 Tax=Nocardioides aurantiacus TaxID=86796 RepID=A0A3N2CUI1_9ACTN|nr:radical SAM superfamily enzyme YgiQ (UPF0313 family) [Nocardioides aurantiacus]
MPFQKSSASLRLTLGRPLINADINSPFFVPLGLLCIASPLVERGHDTLIVDLEYEHRIGQFNPGDDDWLQATCARLLESEPHLVGLTCLADTLPSCLLIGRHLKALRPDVTVVFGGPGTFGIFPGALNRFADCVDFVCRSEGELALAALVDAIADGLDPHAVPGFWSWRDGALVSPGPQPTTNLNLIPMPAYGLVPMHDYIVQSTPHIFDVHIGSGCTYSCKFCMTSTFWDRDFRIKDPAVILEELRFLKRTYGVTQFNFLHDNFGNNRRYLDEFLTYFAEHNDSFEWGCAIRPDNVNPELLRRMREAGCFNIFCGTDAGSEKILKAMLKMPSTKRTYQFFSSAQEEGLQFETNTIIGYPDEADDDLESALEVVFDAISYGASSSDLSVLQPLPGAVVTSEYRDRLEPLDIGQDGMGTFLPSDVRDLVEAERDVFTGFSFIQDGNRSYDFYVDVLRLARYFTRRYYHLLRFLKQVAGMTYVQVFDQLLKQSDRPIRDVLADIVSDLDGDAALAASELLTYEAMLVEFRGDEVEEELVNVYRQPIVDTAKPPFLKERLHVDVLSLISDPVELVWRADYLRPVFCVAFRPTEAEVATVRLTAVQATMFDALQPLSPEDRDRLVEHQPAGGVQNAARAVASICAQIDDSPDARPIAVVGGSSSTR